MSQNSLHNIGNGGMFEDPSEPIYTDPSLFERSRSLRSIDMKQQQQSNHQNQRHHQRRHDLSKIDS